MYTTNNETLLAWFSRQESFLAEHAHQIPMLLNSSDPHKVSDNLVKVEVYFESFDYESVVEVASYKVTRALKQAQNRFLWKVCIFAGRRLRLGPGRNVRFVGRLVLHHILRVCRVLSGSRRPALPQETDCVELNRTWNGRTSNLLLFHSMILFLKHKATSCSVAYGNLLSNKERQSEFSIMHCVTSSRYDVSSNSESEVITRVASGRRLPASDAVFVWPEI